MLQPLPVLDVRPLFRPLGEALVGLLRSLDAEAWERPTVCRLWRARDIAAHLLDTGCRRLSFDRDHHTPPPPPGAIGSYADLLAFLDGLNATWVEASRRLSPALLIELLALVEDRLASWVESAPIDGPALFEVAWAGADADQAWMDIARELTERWLHQQQIRLAVQAPPLGDPEIDGAVFDTFARVWPRALGDAGTEGQRVAVSIAGVASRIYTMVRDSSSWQVFAGLDPEADACVGLDSETAWLVLTKGITPAEAEGRAAIDGRRELARLVLRARAVMG